MSVEKGLFNPAFRTNNGSWRWKVGGSSALLSKGDRHARWVLAPTVEYYGHVKRK